MFVCFQNCSDLLLEKMCSSDREKLLKFKSEGLEFEITRSIYSNSESSVQFLNQNALFLRSNTLGQLELKLEKIILI